MNIKIIGSGCYIPTQVITNNDFDQFDFRDESGKPFNDNNQRIAKKLQMITGIEERRYAENNLTTSDIGTIAAQKAIENAHIDPETIDQIIFAHNFGDIKHGTIQSDNVPSLASRVKHNLKIKNPNCIAYDMLFGCPGWLQGVINAYAMMQSGLAKRCLIIGAETLSRTIDLHDRDSMIYADGAGATIFESKTEEGGILAVNSASYTLEEAFFIHYGKSYHPDLDPDTKYIKMYGRKIYEFALTCVPLAMKACMDKSGVPISKIKKVMIHQANEKMDEAIVKRFFELYNMEMPEYVMPMNIHKLGNSSVATLPTLYDMIINKQIDHHQLEKGDILLFASVGAGMNINAFVYQL
ncbi:3-oxoacyl-ACP synthase III family protein [Myroides sp. LoEW2-1]|uniref:3-oxoacyl-ACP synthase III family protein n=1 Tax=Myroides sp. LoEW2-1 TaxID=2683192 RepID=UPI001321F7F5|nr:ketoacyl-ACP synthase III [Myroides sp. LoEW2-1]MVX34955.1 ketoacyl-ACP synthase III [Myroides sp. LoEW2-1]